MDIFISWSGEKSKRCAEALQEWLPGVIQSLNPWISEHIEKGSRWAAELNARLETAKFGIICITSRNRSAPWLIFESGAISKLPTSRAYTLLLDVPDGEVEGPLAQFQHTYPVKEDVFRLVESLNDHVDTGKLNPTALQRSFERWWPDLEMQFHSLPNEADPAPPARSQESILEEILEYVRTSAKRDQQDQGAPNDPSLRSLSTQALKSIFEDIAAAAGFTGISLHVEHFPEYVQMRVIRTGGPLSIFRVDANYRLNAARPNFLAQLTKALTEK